MCGIFGIQTPNKRVNIKKICSIANKTLNHRGPDDQNIWFNSQTGLSHNRLSIVDVKNAQQPMVSLNGRYVLIYNGEIVNFKELQKNYLPNVKFKTKSDTEVLLELYSKFGTIMLKYIKGMYAFAIYDKLTKNFFLARDHIGIKPLYYFKKNDVFAFSSEIKAFYTTKIKNFEIEKENINEFLVHGTVFGKKTLHENVNELKPGHYLVGSSKSIKIIKYWDVSEVRKNEKKKFSGYNKFN